MAKSITKEISSIKQEISDYEEQLNEYEETGQEEYAEAIGADIETLKIKLAKLEKKVRS